MKDDRELESGATCSPHGSKKQVHGDNDPEREGEEKRTSGPKGQGDSGQ